MNNLLERFILPQALSEWLIWWATLASMLFFFINRIKANWRIEKNTNWGLLVVVGIGIFLLGLATGFLLTRSLFTPLEFLGFYLLILSILQARKRDTRTGRYNYLWLFGASSHILSFVISFLMAESPIAVRVDYALTRGYIRWLVLFAISLVVLAVISVAKRERRFLFNKASTDKRFGNQVSSQHGYRVILFTFAIFLLVSSLVWGIVKPTMMRSIDQELITQTEELVNNSFAYYEMGQALIQLTGNALQEPAESRLSEQDLSQIINRFPLFSQLLLVNGGEISARYPQDGYRLDSNWLEESCEKAAKAGTISSVIKPGDTLPINAFIASTGAGQCVVGLSSYEDTLFFSGLIKKINELSADWAYLDQYGAGIVYGEPGNIHFAQNSLDLSVSPRFSIGQVGNTIVPWVQWQHNVAKGQWQHSIIIVISPALLMNRLSPALFISLVISGIFTFSLMGVVLSQQKEYSGEIASIYAQIKSLADGKGETSPAVGKDVTRDSSFGGLNTAIEEFRHQAAINKHLLLQMEQIHEAESIQTLVNLLKNDSILRTTGEIQLAIYPQLGNQTVFYITAGAMAVPPVSISSGELNHDHHPYTYFIDHEVSGKAIHRYVFHNNGEKLGSFSCMHEEESLSHGNQVYLDTIARQISRFLVQQELSARFKNKDEQWQKVFDKFPFPAMILNSQAELLHINHLAQNMDLINEDLVSNNNVRLQAFLNNQDMVRQIQQAMNPPSVTTSVNVIEHGKYIIHVSKIEQQEHESNQKNIVWFQDISEETEKFSFQANILTTTLHRLRKEFDTLRGRLQLFAASGSLNQSQALHYKEISRSLDEINAFMQATSLEERFSTEANLVLRPINMIDVIIQAIRNLKPFADQNKVAVSFSNKIERADILVLADQMMIMEACKHLLDNAIRYNTIGGHVSIVVTEDESDVAVTIQDTGAGLSALDMARINSDQPLSITPEGTIKFGSGLRLAKSIINKHGGKLSVDSVLGEGTTSRITIPKLSRNENFL